MARNRNCRFTGLLTDIRLYEQLNPVFDGPFGA